MYWVLSEYKMNTKLDLTVVKRKFFIRAIGNIEALGISISNAQVYVIVNVVTGSKS